MLRFYLGRAPLQVDAAVHQPVAPESGAHLQNRPLDHNSACRRFSRFPLPGHAINRSTDSSTAGLGAADFSLLLVTAIWGINMAVMKLAINQLDPFVFNAIRLTLSAVVLGGCAWLQKKRRPSLPPSQNPRHRWWTIVAFALLTGAAYQVIFALGMARTTAGNTALIMSSMPMWTALLSFVILRERLGAAWLGLSITFLGTIIVTLEKGIDIRHEHFLGNALILVAALAWSLAAVISRPLMRSISPVRLAFLATLGTLPIHYLAIPLLAQPTAASWWEPDLLVCIFYSGVFSTGLAYALWNFGVQQLGPSHASVYQNLVPLFALAAAFLMLGETIAWEQAFGGVLIILGLLLTRRWRPAPLAAAAAR